MPANVSTTTCLLKSSACLAMPDPTPLSPAAQAVRIAAINAKPGQTIPAILRTAADRTEADSIWGGHLEHTGVRWAAEQWRAIAAELEGGHA